jgi:hypothetical protein
MAQSPLRQAVGMVPYGGAVYDLGASAFGAEDELPVEGAAVAPVEQPTFTQIPPEREGTPVDQPPTPQRQMTPEEMQAAQDDALRRQLAMVDQRMKIMGLTGGGRPAMRMNELQREGFRLQGQALEEMRAPLDRETELRAKAMRGAQQTGAQYISDLKTLQERQRGEAEARKAVMAEDERRMRETEEGFDASRLLRQMGERPLETTALSFAAGLVGMLKGSAGRTTPNDILAEVDKAVERDVMNQKTAYERMLKGMEVRRTNFLDARQMGADEQAALATTAAASLDQFRRAIDFAAQRVGDAQTKAKLTEASGQLKMQQGDLQMRIDEKNAAAAAAQSARVQSIRMKLLEQAQAAGQANPELAKDLAVRYDSILKGHKPALDAAMAFGNLAKTLRDAQDPQALKDYWNSSVLKAVNAATDKANAAIQSDKNARWFDVMRTAVSEEIGSKAVTPEQKKLAAAAQRLINLNLREVSGGAVTDNELARSIAERVFRSWDGFQDWVGEEYQRTAANVGGLITSNRAHNPALANLLDANYGTGLRLYDEYREQQQNVGRVRQAEAQSRGKR